MSRKGKKKGKGRARPPLRQAGGAPAGTAAIGSQAVLGSPARSVSQARVGGDQALVRAVEMSLGARNQVVKGRGGRFNIESTDPSIPLDRVPYFTRDLVRLVVIGVAMLVLLAVGSFTVPLLVK
jgi:hypothetical protein